jgi:poly(hydroxyalkanoate) depolymerase family esterase
MKNGFGRSLSKALKTQKKFRKLLEKALRAPSARRKRTPPSTQTTPSVLRETSEFGSNPGGLVMKSFVPKRREMDPALVVLLHGCRQTADSLDAASGFSKLARERGFILLYPEQKKANNQQACFNWFRPSAVARDRGELMSIRQMIEYLCVRHRIDRSRIFVAGLSAGAAMTSALVANYPESFAGAAIIAGMPFGAARDAMSALRAMRSGASTPRGGWGRPVREASPDCRSWPPMTIWQGTQDGVVNPVNADACVAQWLEVLGIPEETGRFEEKSWGGLRSWKLGGQVRVALYSVRGLRHGIPIRTAAVTAVRRSQDAFVLPAEISAPGQMMRLWGLRRLWGGLQP